MLPMRFNLTIFLLFAALIFLQYRLWLESGGVSDVLHTKNVLLKQKEEIDQVRHENKKLLSQIDRLKNSKDAAESRARNELGMIKKGETFYQVVK